MSGALPARGPSRIPPAPSGSNRATFVRTAPRLLGAAALLAAALASSTGCDRDVGDLAVFVARSSQVQEDPLDPALVTRLRIRIEGPDMGVVSRTFDNVPGGESTLPPVPVGPDRVITFEGLASEDGPVVSRGESLPFGIGPGRNELQLYVGLVDRFSAASGSGALLQARFGHTASSLPDGRVLVAGGATAGSLDTPDTVEASLELLDPTSGAVVAGGDCRGPDALCLRRPRSGHAAVPLNDGVLLVGGRDEAELIRPAERCTPAGCGLRDALTGRFEGASAGGPGGFVAGGAGVDGPLETVLRVEADGAVSPGPPLLAQRAGAAAAVDGDGALLVLGGGGPGDPAGEVLSGEAFGALPDDGASLRAEGAAVTLPDGRVLFLGGRTLAGAASAEVDLYDPAVGRLCPAGHLQRARWGHTATVLRDGSVLVAGGFTDVATPTDEAERVDARFAPAGRGCQGVAGTLVSRPAARMAHRRAGHAATASPNGLVFVTGGLDETGAAVASVEVFVPAR